MQNVYFFFTCRPYLFSFLSEMILLKEFLHLFSYSNRRFAIERVLSGLGAACKLHSQTRAHCGLFQIHVCNFGHN